jgi:putative lipoprotein
MKTLLTLLLTAGVLLGAAACSSPSASRASDGPVVRGIVTYRARIALPPQAVLTVRLMDVTKADAPAVVLAEKSIMNPGNPPLAFELPYPAGAITAETRVVLEARIDVAGRPRFYSSDTHTITPATAARLHEVQVDLVK